MTIRKKGKKPTDEFIELDLTEDDFGGSFEKSRGLWLGKFTPEQLIADLESHGIFEHLNKRGYTNIQPQIECEGFESALLITGDHASKTEPQLLVEVHARLTNSKILSQLDDEAYSSVIFDWVLFQDPCAEFDPEHPRLPGQSYPGLDIFKLGSKLMLEHVDQLNVELVINHPQHFHNAVIYSPPYRFIDPLSEGHFLALKRDLLLSHTLAEASQALDDGKVIDQAGTPVVWKQNAQVWPRDKRMEGKLFGEDYQQRALEASGNTFRYLDSNSPEP